MPAIVAPPFTSRLIPGRGFACALLENGGVSCWGLNDAGQLGEGGLSSSRPTPAPVLPP